MKLIPNFPRVFPFLFLLLAGCHCLSRTVINLWETLSKYVSNLETKMEKIRRLEPVKIRGINATVPRFTWKCPRGSMSMPRSIQIESGFKGVVLIPVGNKKIVRGALLLKQIPYSFEDCTIFNKSSSPSVPRYNGPIYGIISSLTLIVDIVIQPGKRDRVRCKTQSVEKIDSTVSLRASDLMDEKFFKELVAGRSGKAVSRVMSGLLKDRVTQALPSIQCDHFQPVTMELVPPKLSLR